MQGDVDSSLPEEGGGRHRSCWAAELGSESVGCPPDVSRGGNDDRDDSRSNRAAAVSQEYRPVANHWPELVFTFRMSLAAEGKRSAPMSWLDRTRC